jgi:zinc protease
MLRKFFIPLMMALIVAAAVVYWFHGRAPHGRDLREAVPVEHFTLSNGLTVVVMPNARIPAVTHLLVVKSGAADDPEGKSGLAHYVEHLMFTGTKDYPEGVYDRAIARVGGTQNAYTTEDYTLYFATVAREHLPTVMAMEADRFQHLAFDAAHAARELKVITEERNMRVDNSASAQLSEQLNAITFLNHPYRQPTIGWAEDMATLTADDARQFFANHYRASNMVLVVAGDVTVRDVRRYAQRYYGGMPGGESAPRAWPKEPPVRLMRHAQMEDAKAREPLLIRQYIAPSMHDGDSIKAMPLAVFAQYLGGGESSLLYEQLVRQQKLASAVTADYDPLAVGPALFRITATPVEGVTLPQLEEGLDRALASTLAAAPDNAAVTRAKTLLKAEVIFAQDGLTPLAHLMAELYAIGLDEQYFYSWSNAIDHVTAAEMQAAAQAVLVPAKRITGYLTPLTAPQPAAVLTTEAPHAP